MTIKTFPSREVNGYAGFKSETFRRILKLKLPVASYGESEVEMGGQLRFMAERTVHDQAFISNLVAPLKVFTRLPHHATDSHRTASQ